MISREQEKNPKVRIVSTCIQLFIEQGYKKTTMLEIIKEADVSAGTFQNIFKTKDGVLKELVDVMFEMQFEIAKDLSKNISKVTLYALETSIQLAIAELNENIREIYVEAYSHPEILDYINEKTLKELIYIFNEHLPLYEESDFYEIEIATSGIMRSFMMKPCDKYFTFRKKLKRFLSISLSIFKISEEEQKTITDLILDMDIINIAKQVLNKLLDMLSMKYEFQFHNVIEH